MELVQAIGEFLKLSWGFFKLEVPGTNFSFAALFISFFLAGLGLDLVFSMVGVSYGHSEQQTVGDLVEFSRGKHRVVHRRYTK